MTRRSTFSDYAARLREFMIASAALEFSGRDEPFNELALQLFALQFQHNPPYRRFCERQNLFSPAASQWHAIPAMPIVAFKELEVTSLPAAERTTVFHSSGTTADKPSRHFHNSESLAIYESSLLAWFKPHLLAGEEQRDMLFLTPGPAAAPHSSLVHMFEIIRRRFGVERSLFAGTSEVDAGWGLEPEGTFRFLNEATQAVRPLALLGTAFNLVHLLDHLAEKKRPLRLPAGSTVLETGGYKGRSRTLAKAELYGLITQYLGIPASHIVSEYGMTELSSQAYDSRVSRSELLVSARVFHFPSWARVQIVSPETGREVAEGETGLIRVFDLANVRSVMAIQTEDLGVKRGAGFEWVGRAAQADSRGCSLMSVYD